MGVYTDLVNRLRGRYPVGPIQENGEPEFGYRQFHGNPPIQLEAASRIEGLYHALEALEAVLAYAEGKTPYVDPAAITLAKEALNPEPYSPESASDVEADED